MSDPPGSHDFVYVHTDIPEGMTIREWRAERADRVAELRDAQRRARRERRSGIANEFRRRLMGFGQRLTARARSLPRSALR
jgi:hypothetical protein